MVERVCFACVKPEKLNLLVEIRGLITRTGTHYHKVKSLRAAGIQVNMADLVNKDQEAEAVAAEEPEAVAAEEAEAEKETWVPYGGFTLQECSRNISLPAQIDCLYAHDVEISSYVKLTGRIRTLGPKAGSSRIVFVVETIGYISKEDAFEDRPCEATWFNENNLKALQLCSEDMLQRLNSQAAKEGFKLVHKKSLKEPHITFRCYQHSFYGKKEKLNAGCHFQISISRSNTSNLYHVTKFNTSHEHLLNPLLFAHHALDSNTHKLLTALLSSHVKIPQVISVLSHHCHVDLSASQVRCLARGFRRNIKVSESTDLYDSVVAKGGQAFYLQHEDPEGNVHRSGVATFNKMELETLQKYGDFIAIDPTFSPMSSEWTIIPLTAVTSERKIASAGIIFVSNTKGTTFLWILQLLLTVLPCRDRLATLCSDDDVGLEGAFHLAAECDDEVFKEKVGSLKRIICFWHKSVNFCNYIQTLGLTHSEKTKALELFRFVGMSRNEDFVNKCIGRLRMLHVKIGEYLDRNIVPKLESISKAFIGHHFTAGYNTSSLAESHNSALKSFVQGQMMTLVEMRDAVDELQRQQTVNDSYIRGRKPHREENAQLLDAMMTYGISKRVAQSIVGSDQKSNKITCRRRGPSYVMEEEVKLGENETEIIRYELSGRKRICPCCKLEQTGIPCSHILRLLKEQGVPLTPDLIHQRWITENVSTTDQVIETLPPPELIREIVANDQQGGVQSVTGRYVLLLSQGRDLAQIASKSAETFKKVSDTLKELEDELLHPKTSTPIDDHGVRPGRKPSKRKRH